MASPIELINSALFNDPSLVAYWRLENTSDSKGSNTLINNGAVTFTAGQFSNAATFASASSQYLNSPTRPVNSGNFTVTGWVNFSASPSSGQIKMIAAQGQDGVVQSWWFGWQNNAGTNQLVADIFDGTHDGQATYVFTPSLNTWYHFAIVFDGSNIIIYWNGVNHAQAAYTFGYSTSDHFYLGRYVTNAFFMDGQIDDVAVLSRALTANEVSYLANGNWPIGWHPPTNQPYLERTAINSY